MELKEYANLFKDLGDETRLLIIKELILNKEYGYMVGIKNGETVKVPLEEVAGKLKMVDPASKIVKEAKLTGISFGDE